jgi:DNA (cytosine-5)-methyltransferase 1
MRERMFLIAYKKELSTEVSFPEPTHHWQLPRGYNGSRQVALKTVKAKDLLNEDHYYQEAPSPTRDLKKAVTALEAIGDLPTITAHLEGKLGRGARRFTDIMEYDRRKKESPYARLMKTWPGFSNDVGIKDHQIRYLPRDYPLFRRMNHGDQYPEAFKHAQTMFEEALIDMSSRGKKLSEGSKAYQELHKMIVPPYDPGKFPNKWRKMEPDAPARTLLAHLGKDSYTHIHYDCDQARTISVREAARLQSFPDGFEFCGTMNPAFRQIGNAVPPLMAKSIAKVMRSVLKQDKETREADGSLTEVAAA